MAVAVGLGAALLYAWPYTVDDAHIVARYAARLASGRGYTFSDGPATDGITSPLWLALCAVWAAAGGDPLLGAKALGAASTLLAGAYVAWGERRRACGRRAAWLLVLCLATSLPLIIWAVAGLETGLATLAVVVLARAPSLAVGALAAGLLPWLRPELVPAGLALAASGSTRAHVRWRSAGIVLGLLSVVAFRAILFGRAWPMTAAAKPAMLDHGLGYLVDAARPAASLLLALGALLGARVVRGGGRLALVLGVHGLAVLLAGGDWMPAARLFAPLVPLAATSFARAAAVASLRWRWAPLALVAFAVARVLGLLVDLPTARAEQRHAPVLDALVAALPAGPGPVVALDVGWLGARIPGSIVDLGGLTEPRIAYAAGGHLDKRVDGAWLERCEPRALVLHSALPPQVDDAGRLRWFAGYPVERRVLAFPWVQREFRVLHVFRYDASYFYVVLGRVAERGR